MYYYLIYGFISYNKQIYQHVPACMTSKIPRRMVDRRRGMIAVGLDSYIRVDISIPKPYLCGVRLSVLRNSQTNNG